MSLTAIGVGMAALAVIGGGMDIYTIASQVQQVIKEEEEEKTDSLFESIRTDEKGEE